jgi:hypothetical protein
MIQRFFIATRLPGMNEIVAWSKVRRGNWSKYAENKLAYEAIIKADIRTAKLRPVKGLVILAFHWVESDAKRDYGNIRVGEKFISDALVSAKILRTDAQAQVIGFRDTFDVDKSNPGVWVMIEEQPETSGY